MKAKPIKNGVECEASEATHVILNIPGPTETLTLPVILRGSRDEASERRQEPCWTWNGDTEAPTLKPSVLTRGHDFRCHSWINDGEARFLSDCSHEYAGQTVPLLDLCD